MGTLDGRCAMVTGAGSGIGRASAEALAGLGAELLVQDISAKGAHATVASIHKSGGRAHSAVCDVGDEAALAAALEHISPVTILVNNAGVPGGGATIEQIDHAEYERLMDVHLWGAYAATRAVIAGMKQARWGRIVNIASERGQIGFETSSHYCAAKAALIGVSKAWAREFAPWNILCNAVAPGVTRTGMTVPLGEAAIAEEADLTLLKRAAEPHEIAQWVATLCTPTGDYMTAQVLCPNGGLAIVGI